GLSGYTRLKIEEGVQSIPDAMFHSSNVVEIEGGFPESLTSIGKEAFRSTSYLTGPLTIPATVMELGSLAFFFSNLSEGVIIPDDSRLTSVEDAFTSTDIPFIHIPDGVKEIGPNAFNYCRKLKKVTGLANVTKIGSSAFASCSIEEISLPDGLEIIGDMAFYSTSLVSIDMPEGVTTVTGAFRGCTSLQEIVLPSTLRDLKVTSNGWVPFYTSDTELTVNVWYCMTSDSPFTPESAALVCRDENFYTKVKTPFTHYYVLDGMKDHMKSLCDVFDYEEVAAAITELPVEMRQNGLQVEMTCNPVFTQSIASEADKATMSDAEELADAVRIPEHFANANAGHIHSQTKYTLESKNEVLPASLEVEVDFDEDGKPVVNATFEGPSEGGEYRLVAEHPVKGRVESDWFKSDSATTTDVATLRADIAGYVVADGVLEISAPEASDVCVYGIDGALLFKGRGNCRYVIHERKIVILMIGTEVYKVVI
ncbi:MAG: leucine-rich repeat domain-containing protein, partial [Muribaculaceae bacterium]|nr:leucine-rich repeat domain-containing protein [Muribaculaceae bacterium]